ncbi:MAG: Hsp70 family protein, partial [Ruminococcus sp.]|nr:Hsp70 family protein [Ruminococcus sp.]
FEEVITPYVQKTVDITRRVVDRIKVNRKYVRKIIMAGGSSQLSVAEKLLKEEFENDGIEIILSDSVFDLIAKGALFMAEQQKIIRVEEKTTTQFGVGVRTGIGIKKFEKLIDVNVSLPVSGSKIFKIDNQILKHGVVEIPCYEKDINNYPDSVTERDKGIEHINTYKIAVDRKLNPHELQVTFTIEVDGTLNLNVQLINSDGKEVKEFNAEIMSDNEIE